MECQATFSNYCHYPKCDCDREPNLVILDCDCVVFDGENPEWTEEDFKKEKPFKEVFPHLLENKNGPA